MATVVTKTIKPAGGGDYTTLAAWEIARRGNLVTRDTIEIAECHNGNCGQFALSVGTWTTDNDRYIHIKAAQGSECKGLPDQTKAHISLSSISTAVLLNGLTAGSPAGSIIFEGFYIKQDYDAVGILDDTQAIVKNCLVVCNGNPSFAAVRRIYSAENVIVCNAGIGFSFNSTGANASNCTVASCELGFLANSSGYGILKNCLAQGCTDGFSGTFNAASDYNCSNIAGDAPGANSITGTVQFVDSANNDYHLAAADTVARGAGVNLTASGITTDIDGDARPASGAWDIGADQYVAATPPVTERDPWGKKPWSRQPWNRARWKAAA